jgi:hypothetical protein
MNALPRHAIYQYGGGHEQCLCFGPDDAERRILILPPLFDEMNRTRHTLVQAMRVLAVRSIASCLPDYPGCNESNAALAQQSINSWRGAIVSAANSFGVTHIFSVRGGGLLDDAPGLPVIRLASVKGASLVKILVRTQIASDKESGIPTTADGLAQQALSGTVTLAGNVLSAQLWSDLDSALPAQSHMISEMHLADVQGSALWLRAEPGYNADMSAALAEALDTWSAQA